jgi:hypothetical protein
MHTACDARSPVMNADLDNLHSELEQLHSWVASSTGQQDKRPETAAQEGGMIIRGK